MSTRDLIDAIQSGDSIAVQSAFEASMAERVASRLDAMRQEVAQTMFKEQVEEIEEELNLEDYSLEEIEDFMMSEEFEQLDELSKDTLKSYIDKTKDPDRKGSLANIVDKQGRKGMKSPEFKKRLASQRKAVDKWWNPDYGFKGMKEEIEEATDKVGDNHLHVQEVKHEGKTKYKVHAVGKNFADGIKVGEHLSDTELDDFQEMGGKVKHVK